MQQRSGLVPERALSGALLHRFGYISFFFLLVGRNQRRQLCTDTASSSFMLQCKPLCFCWTSSFCIGWGDLAVHTHPHSRPIHLSRYLHTHGGILFSLRGVCGLRCIESVFCWLILQGWCDSGSAVCSRHSISDSFIFQTMLWNVCDNSICDVQYCCLLKG